MTDRESVITHLQIISTWASFARERDLQFFTAKHLEDIAQWSDDAIVLLKEQEAIKPHYNARTNWYECGACHYSMTSGMHCRNELIPAYKVGFCAKCGRSVKWDD